MQFKERFRQSVFNKVYLESSVDVQQAFKECFFTAAKYWIFTCSDFIGLFSSNASPPGLWSPLSLGEQLHREAKLPLLLSVSVVTDSSHDRRLHLRLNIHPAPHGWIVEAALHGHVSLCTLSMCGRGHLVSALKFWVYVFGCRGYLNPFALIILTV